MTKTEFQIEKSAIRKAKSDPRSFDYLYQKYFPRINNFVFHRVKDENIKNEIVSNVFFKAMKKITLFKLKKIRINSFSAWLFRIAINETNDYFRKENREKKIRSQMENRNPISFKYPINFDIIQEKIQQLPFYEQNLISLRFFEKFKHKEIAYILGKKENTIKVQMHRTLQKLRKLLEGEINYE
ncbi:MAG: RNA polymerase sigma factor [Candidatus Cloacimonadota bacterium]|nr:RNA polymerase sigma factor [Candidatus Cloacimonadota bacterium]